MSYRYIGCPARVPGTMLAALLGLLAWGLLPAPSHAQSDEPLASDERPAGRTVRAAPPAPGAPPYAFHSTARVTRPASTRYGAGPVWSFFFGDDHRDVWHAPVEIPVLDLGRTAGGLTPFERGGGLQTKSLHLRGADGHEYHLRSVDKNAARSLPEGFHGTVVADVAQDQTSAMNPYGAVIVPRLAEAAGVLHAVPTLVVVPDDERLGEYRSEYAGMLALLERKPDEDQSDAPNFGRATNVVGSEKMLEEIVEDNDDRVDAHAYARARLFDMLIGDWDRHDEQWRWAEFEDDHGKRFVAVPRDRDFAFSRFDGALLRVGRLTGNVTLRRFADFGEKYGDVFGLNWQGSKLDRRLTGSLSREDWVALAEDLRVRLDDAEIEAAVRAWPAPVFDEIGEETIAALKSRRDRLPRVAEDYYELLAHTVDLVGTDKHERFEVTHLGGGRTEVTVYKTQEDGTVVRELMRRTFVRDETEEVRLYGLGGNDTFVVQGEGRGVRVRAVGGNGADTFADRSAASRLNHFYDTTGDNTWEPGPDTRVHRSADTLVNRYVMERFRFDQTSPLLSFDYDSDDGVFVGGGLRHVRHGFRKEPYAAMHVLKADYAPLSRGFNVHYEADFVRLVGGWNVGVVADVRDADRFRYFYGLGNETVRDARDRFRAQLQQVTVEPMLYRPLGGGVSLGFGPAFDYANIEPLPGWAEGDPASGFTPEEFRDKYFAGAQTRLDVDRRDTLVVPRQGWRWQAAAGYHMDLRGTDHRFARLASEASAYVPLPGPFTLALRAGGATNLGSFAFYQANTLGGTDNLRGYGRTRFAGRSSVYTNAELRMRLADFNVYLTRGTMGLLAFYDTGRVWSDGEHSTRWHQGYGGGLWLTPFERFLVTTTVGVSPESTVFDLSFGFLF